MKKKTIAIALACVLLLCCVVGGTMAWLTASTGEVKNTFTVGDINISIAETGAEGTSNLTKTYHFVPGDELKKDPSVTVAANSEACYLFVKVIESNNTATGLTGKIVNWQIAEGWTAVPDTTGYYYRIVDAATAKAGKTYQILKDDKVTINTGITKTMVDTDIEKKPLELSFSAAAVQIDNLADEKPEDGADADAIAAVEAANLAAAWGERPDGF